jgi:hypothetical protein
VNSGGEDAREYICKLCEFAVALQDDDLCAACRAAVGEPCTECLTNWAPEDLTACGERGCKAKLCPDCKHPSTDNCREHSDPDGVPGDWWAGGFAKSH